MANRPSTARTKSGEISGRKAAATKRAKVIGKLVRLALQHGVPEADVVAVAGKRVVAEARQSD